uniref:Protein kinase domain-containing protein n=1 Tax=Ursus maritimus TaxID=29073 RepID=A0A452TIG7_URSMA
MSHGPCLTSRAVVRVVGQHWTSGHRAVSPQFSGSSRGCLCRLVRVVAVLSSLDVGIDGAVTLCPASSSRHLSFPCPDLFVRPRGFAFVYEAQDLGSGREYALKRLLSNEEEKNRAIIQEVCFMKKLSGHPNIVQGIRHWAG